MIPSVERLGCIPSRSIRYAKDSIPKSQYLKKPSSPRLETMLSVTQRFFDLASGADWIFSPET